ncbi:MAG: hypothetical protein V4622_00155 [Bacteroidota bacterium]
MEKSNRYTQNYSRLSYLFLFIFLSYIFCSCNPLSYSSHVDYTVLSQTNCENRTENVFLFFDGEQTDFEYQKLGLIEVKQIHSQEMTFDLMKEQAYKMCGNAVINIKKNTTSEIYTDKNNKIQTYNRISYTGIAVAIDGNSGFMLKNQDKIDTNFLTLNRKNDEKLNNPASRALGIFLGLILGLCKVILELYPE